MVDKTPHIQHNDFVDKIRYNYEQEIVNRKLLEIFRVVLNGSDGSVNEMWK